MIKRKTRVNNIPMGQTVNSDTESDDSDSVIGQAQNNPKANQPNNKKVVGENGAAREDQNSSNKSRL